MPVQQVRRVLRAEPVDPQFVESGGPELRRVRVPYGEDQRDPLGVQPAGREDQRLRRRPVQPLRVVDQAEQRLLLGQFGEQRQHRQSDEEPVAAARRGVPHPERRPQRPGLRPRQAVDPVEHGPQQQVQPGVRQRALELDTGPAQDPQPGPGAGHHVVEQGRLADPGLPAQHEYTAAPVPGVPEQPLDDAALPNPPQQHGLSPSGVVRTFCQPLPAIRQRPLRGMSGTPDTVTASRFPDEPTTGLDPRGPRDAPRPSGHC